MVSSICFQLGGGFALPEPAQRAASRAASTAASRAASRAASTTTPIPASSTSFRTGPGDRGRSLMKDYGERSGHSNFRRLFAGIDDDTMLPRYFMHPINQPPRPRTSRLASVKRLRKLERRSMWWYWLRCTIESWLFSMSRYNPYRSYRDQLRFSAR